MAQRLKEKDNAVLAKALMAWAMRCDLKIHSTTHKVYHKKTNPNVFDRILGSSYHVYKKVKIEIPNVRIVMDNGDFHDLETDAGNEKVAMAFMMRMIVELVQNDRFKSIKANEKILPVPDVTDFK